MLVAVVVVVVMACNNNNSSTSNNNSSMTVTLSLAHIMSHQSDHGSQLEVGMLTVTRDISTQ